MVDFNGTVSYLFLPLAMTTLPAKTRPKAKGISQMDVLARAPNAVSETSVGDWSSNVDQSDKAVT